jgi:hypothetical protein
MRTSNLTSIDVFSKRPPQGPIQSQLNCLLFYLTSAANYESYNRMRKGKTDTTCDKTWRAPFAILFLTIPGLPEGTLITVDISAYIGAEISHKQSKSLHDCTWVFISIQVCIGRLYIEETELLVCYKSFNRFEWQACQASGRSFYINALNWIHCTVTWLLLGDFLWRTKH